MVKVQLIAALPEDLIVYCARVSSPKQDTENAPRLLKYLIDHNHWSPFEMSSMVLEIETSRAISAQILRHRSFSFQELSQRYASVEKIHYEVVEPRRQDSKNRQNSIDDLPMDTKEWFRETLESTQDLARVHYETALSKGVAKECARFLLPMNVGTRLYMHGTVRSWVHYLEARCAPEAQKEHRDVALAAKEIFVQQYPNVAKALWGGDDS